MKPLVNFCVKLVGRYLPDPFIFCALLTFITFLLAIPVANLSLTKALESWNTGFWGLLTFSMQMALVLVFGHALASSKPFTFGLDFLSSKVKTPPQAIILVSFISLIASWLNWGFGLVIGAIFAKEIAEKVKGVDYRLLIASAYSGFLVWHGGLSGSVPLAVATSGNLAQVTQGKITEVISVSETLFSPLNLAILLSLIVTLPFLNSFMLPKKNELVTIDPKLLEEEEEALVKVSSFSDRLEHSSMISIVLAAMGLGYIGLYFFKNGFSLNLNIVNSLFLFLGILFHQTPHHYLKAIKKATAGATGILLQFPFYGGIMGLMTALGDDGHSLAGSLSQLFASISNETTFPLFTFLSAGLVNFFVPSGGGQWAVQAAIMLPASSELGVPLAKTALAIAWGDAWTNMVQPFWALPALGIAGLNAKDIMGFCLITLLYSGLVISTFLLIL